ncbi:MAG: PAS domain S-box protein, partial [Gemmatimonadetes bacterium]|nr:PAS domain S-box protein [Gemmatimonadota bacterium]NIW66584.1 PAS domain S-box protein [Gemmatimonadota bacterium]
EAGLLEELAADLAYGLGVIRDRVRWREEREQLVSLLENTPDFVEIADRTGRVIYRNNGAWRMLGLDPRSDTEARDMGANLTDWAYGQLQEVGLPTARAEGAWQGESALRRSDGSEVPVSQIIVAHFGPDGEVT